MIAAIAASSRVVPVRAPVVSVDSIEPEVSSVISRLVSCSVTLVDWSAIVAGASSSTVMVATPLAL